MVFAKVSPQNRKSLTPVSSEEENSGAESMRSAYEGVETHTSMSDAARAASWPAMLCWVPWVRLAKVPPEASAPAISKTERSKENGAWSR